MKFQPISREKNTTQSAPKTMQIRRRLLGPWLLAASLAGAISPYGRRQGLKSPLFDGAKFAEAPTGSSAAGGTGSADHQQHIKKLGRPKYVKGNGVDVPKSCIPKPNAPGQPITVFVTTISQPYMFGAKSRNFDHTIWGPDSRQNIKNKLANFQ